MDACVFVATSIFQRARMLDRLRTIYEKTRRISERLAREHPDLPFYAEKHAMIEILGSLSMAMNGEHARAAADADRAAALAPRSGLVADYAACCLTIAAQAVGRDAQLAPADRQSQADRYLDRAMDYLRQMQASRPVPAAALRRGPEERPRSRATPPPARFPELPVGAREISTIGGVSADQVAPDRGARLTVCSIMRIRT